MYLVQLLLPRADNNAKAFPAKTYGAIRDELTQRFGGLTAFTRAPAVGLWKDADHTVNRDDVMVFEVMTDLLDRRWWRNYRSQLETLFRQDIIIIRAQKIEQL